MERTADRKVLIVDDDRLICRALERELALRRLDHRSAGSGSAFLEEITRQRYDVVFLAVRLPDANGIDLLRTVRRISPETRVIVLSGDGSRRDQETAIAEGAVQFLEKPFDLSLVGGIVDALFSARPERRKAPRYCCNLRVWIRLEKEPVAGPKQLAGKAEEIGPDGIRISTVIPLEPGRTVWLRPFDPDRPFLGFLSPGEAVVAWMQAEPPGYAAGLRYLTPARISGSGSAASRS